MTRPEPLDRAGRPGGQGYRAHIDGLRALAVTLVIGFHLGLQWMPGGFVGVDVFFVISGYLITGLLARELERDGRLRLGRFYARRVRRLLPAGALVIVTVIGLSAWLLDAVDRRAVGLDAVAAALYFANWRFVAERAEYFTPGDVPSPLIHFWSLSIEEQFYLVWPALLLLGWRLCVRRGPATTGRLELAILAAILVSATLSVTLVPSGAAYYGTHTRAYQLLTGALLCLLVARLGDRVPDRRGLRFAAGVGAVAGLAAIVALAASIPDAAHYPGWSGLAVTAASALALACLELPGAGWARRAVGHAAPALVGRMSYSLYIWHWPVLAFAPVLAERWKLAAPTQLGPQLAVIALAASASYVLVERPFRYGVGLRAPARAVVATGLAVSLAVAIVQAPLLQPSDERAARPGTTQARPASAGPPPAELSPVEALEAVDDNAQPGRCPYFNEDWEPIAEAEPCVHRQGERPVVALVGDSHALQWQPALERIAQRRGIELLRVTRRGCPANWLDIFYLNDQGLPRDDYGCRQWRERLYPRLVARDDPDVVFVATRSHDWRINDGGRVVERGDGHHVALWSRAWDRTLRTLTAGGARVVVSLVPPRIPFRPPACLADHGSRSGRCDVPASVDRAVVPYNRVIAGLERRFPGVAVIDPTPLICPRGTCPAVMGGTVVHRDDDHITATFARSLADELEALLGAAGAQLGAKG